MKEVFKDIPNYEGMYQVSNLGNVKSLAREYLNRGKYPATTKEQIMRICLTGNGYPFVIFYKNGKTKSQMIHRLLAIAFIPNPENKKQVNHINGIKHDNRLENLEWNTSNENMQHATDNKLLDNRGEKHTNSKLTTKEVLYIRKSNATQNELAKIFNVSVATISLIKRRIAWKYV